ncbi:MAG: cysteine desulfurase [Candidatus Yonathbacteria bacterium]|nr:cysteine desulfurase [Candidatus Yonathbacteria bacterium]
MARCKVYKKFENKGGMGYYDEMRRIYLDYAAATPPDTRALKVMNDTSKKFYGNPSSLHLEGQEAKKSLENARGIIAGTISAHPNEIIFTSGATEANNMAIRGVVSMARERGIKNPHIIISAIEHPSILEVAEALQKEGVSVSRLSVDHRGTVNAKELRKLINENTVLVSVMYANNEIGTVEPIRDIAKEIRHARKTNNSSYPYFHTDGAQAANYLDLNVLKLGVDLMTISSGKTYGPRGIGALFVRRGIILQPLLQGGEHESGRRAGTEGVALAVGFAEALILAEKIKTKEYARVKKLRDNLAEKILKKIPDCVINGDIENGLPNILNISVAGCDSEALVIYLDAIGIAVSGKSSCKSSDRSPSHVIMALGGNDSGTIRFSLGRNTKKEDIARVAQELPRIIALLRACHTQSDQV